MHADRTIAALAGLVVDHAPVPGADVLIDTVNAPAQWHGFLAGNVQRNRSLDLDLTVPDAPTVANIQGLHIGEGAETLFHARTLDQDRWQRMPAVPLPDQVAHALRQESEDQVGIVAGCETGVLSERAQRIVH